LKSQIAFSVLGPCSPISTPFGAQFYPPDCRVPSVTILAKAGPSNFIRRGLRFGAMPTPL
jgi:hypothetical protein